MKICSKICLTIGCLFAVASFAQPAYKKAKPLPIQQTLGARYFVSYLPIDLSPDGRWVAFTCNHARQAANGQGVRYSRLTPTGIPVNFVGSDIWIAYTRTGEAQNITNGKGTNWAPVWSPKGDYLAFNSDRSGESHLWLWEKSSGKLRQLSTALVSSGIDFEGPQWTPDGKQLVVRILPNGMGIEGLLDAVYGPRTHQHPDRGTQASVKILESPAAATQEKRQKVEGGASVFEMLRSDLAVIDVASGTVRRIARNLRPYTFKVSPDGSYVAVMSYVKLASLASQRALCEVTLVSLKTDGVRTVASNVWWNMKPMSWSPDGRSLVYGTLSPEDEDTAVLVSVDQDKPRTLRLPKDFGVPGHCPWLWDAAGQAAYTTTADSLWRITLNSGTASKIARIPNHTLLTLIAGRRGFEVWLPGSESEGVALARDDRTLQEGFWKINLSTGEYRRLWEQPVSHDLSRGDASDAFKVSEDDHTIVYLREDTQHPEDVWAAGADLHSPRRVTNVNPGIDQYVLGESRLISWRSLDGATLKGALLLPAGYERDKRYPLVVYTYGGSSLSTKLNQWGGGPILLNLQILATRGYAVLLPDTPLRVGTPMQDLAKTVLPGVEKVVELGIADPERVGVIGQSFGGYSTLALIEQSSQFKAAVDFAGLTSLVSCYANDGLGGAGDEIGWVEEGWGRMGGLLWQFRDRFIENSPLFYLDRIQTPVLIIHGDTDTSVPVREGHLAFQSLRRLGKRAVYAEYNDEGHIPQYWTYGDEMDLDSRIVAWFDRFLKQ